MRALLSVPGGVAMILGFVHARRGWLRMELHVTRAETRVKLVACCGPNDLSAHEQLNENDERCGHCAWTCLHTVLRHDHETDRLLS
jgi:hypothetical protein